MDRPITNRSQEFAYTKLQSNQFTLVDNIKQLKTANSRPRVIFMLAIIWLCNKCVPK